MGTPNVVADRVLVTFTTTGTGTYTFGAAVAGYLTPNAAGIAQTGARVAYVAVDSLTAPTTFEVGEGDYTFSTTTITRATIHRNSSGGTTAVSWGSGTKYLFLAPSAARLPVLETDGRLTLTGGLNVTGGGAAVTGNATVTGTMTVNNGLTVGGGGATVAGNSVFSNNVTVSGKVITSPGTGILEAVVYDQFLATYGPPGAVSFPGGLKMKWGTGSVTSGSGSVTYATAFTSATLNVQLTISAGTNSSTQDALILGATTAAGFAVWGSTTTNVAFNWLAIGY
jgi:hypothetical protein